MLVVDTVFVATPESCRAAVWANVRVPDPMMLPPVLQWREWR
jgi:hypothetical protein